MIKLYTLFPDRLNLNGDQGNLVVLLKRLAWSKVGCEIVNINSVGEIESLAAELQVNPTNAFVFLGHGSIAAMKSISQHKTEIEGLIALCRNLGVPAMLVGSSYSWLVPHAVVDRVSEFRTLDLVFAGETHEVTGYLNSSDSLPAIVAEGNTIYTLLHGPVLLKSLTLTEAICRLLSQAEMGKLDDRIVGYVSEATAVAKGERS